MVSPGVADRRPRDVGVASESQQGTSPEGTAHLSCRQVCVSCDEIGLTNYSAALRRCQKHWAVGFAICIRVWFLCT